MSPELKQRWLQALRGGAYEQACGALCAHGQYCCLGVLADIEGIRHFAPASELSRDEVFDFPHPHRGHEHTTTIPPARWLRDRGMTWMQAVQLSDMNDRGTPFAEIADFIERNL